MGFSNVSTIKNKQIKQQLFSQLNNKMQVDDNTFSYQWTYEKLADNSSVKQRAMEAFEGEPTVVKMTLANRIELDSFIHWIENQKWSCQYNWNTYASHEGLHVDFLKLMKSQ